MKSSLFLNEKVEGLEILYTWILIEKFAFTNFAGGRQYN